MARSLSVCTIWTMDIPARSLELLEILEPLFRSNTLHRVLILEVLAIDF